MVRLPAVAEPVDAPETDVRPAAPPRDEDSGTLGAAEEPEDELMVLEVGDRFWAGSATVGYELVARFTTPEAMATLLDPRQPVLTVEDREWSLGKILVSVDYGGAPDQATWRVAGPPEVIEVYVGRLRDTASVRSPLFDLGVLPLDVRYGDRRPGARVVPPEEIRP
jgi:hypothetical protein